MKYLGNCEGLSKPPDVWLSVKKLSHDWLFLSTSGCFTTTDIFSCLFYVKCSFLVMILYNRIDVKMTAVKQIMYLPCIIQATDKIMFGNKHLKRFIVSVRLVAFDLLELCKIWISLT